MRWASSTSAGSKFARLRATAAVPPDTGTEERERDAVCGSALVTAVPRYPAGPLSRARTAAVEAVERFANHRGSGTR